jgi:hypothetical protein
MGSNNAVLDTIRSNFHLQKYRMKNRENNIWDPSPKGARFICHYRKGKIPVRNSDQ